MVPRLETWAVVEFCEKIRVLRETNASSTKKGRAAEKASSAKKVRAAKDASLREHKNTSSATTSHELSLHV